MLLTSENTTHMNQGIQKDILMPRYIYVAVQSSRVIYK